MSRLEVELFDPPPDPDLVCAICQCVMTEPMEASRCRHVFCRACIETWLGGGARTCPTCRAVLTTFDLCRALPLLYNVIGRLVMQCINKAAGCDARLAVERLDMHLQNDCQWVAEPCQCGQNVLRRDRETHMFSCEFCVMRCTGVCELMFPVRDHVNHDCVAALKQIIEEQKQSLNELTRQLEAATALNKRLEKQLRDSGQLLNVQQSAAGTAAVDDHPVDDLIALHSPASTELDVNVQLPESSVLRPHSERELEQFVSEYFNPTRSPVGNNVQLDASSQQPLLGNFYGFRNPFSWRFGVTPPSNVPSLSSQRFANNLISGSLHRRNSDFESRPTQGSAFHARHSLLSMSLSPPAEHYSAVLRPEVLVRLRLGNNRQSLHSQTPFNYSPPGSAEHSPHNIDSAAAAAAGVDDAAVDVIPAHSLPQVDEHDDDEEEDGNRGDVIYGNPENSPNFDFNHDSRSNATSVERLVASPALPELLNDSHSIHFSSNPPSVDSELSCSLPHSRTSELRSGSPTEFEHGLLDHNSAFELDVHHRTASSTPASFSNNSHSERRSSNAESHFTERDTSPRSHSRSPVRRTYHSDSEDSWYSSSRRHLHRSSSPRSFSPGLSSNNASPSPVSEHLAFNGTRLRWSAGAATEFSERERNQFSNIYVFHQDDVGSNIATDRIPEQHHMDSPVTRTPVRHTHSNRLTSQLLSPHFSPDRSQSPESHFLSRFRSPSYYRLSRSPACDSSFAGHSPGYNPSLRSDSNISLDFSATGSNHSYFSYHSHSPPSDSPEFRQSSPGNRNLSSSSPETHHQHSHSPDPSSPETHSRHSSHHTEHLTPSTHTPSSQHIAGCEKAAANAVSDADSNNDDNEEWTSHHYRVPANCKRLHSDSSDSEDGNYGNHKKLRHS